MKLHAIRCVSGVDDPKVFWTSGDWFGNDQFNGNPVTSQHNAKLFHEYDEAKGHKLRLETLGCKFIIVSWVLIDEKELEKN